MTRTTVEKYSPLAAATLCLTIVIAAVQFVLWISDGREKQAERNGQNAAQIESLNVRVVRIEDQNKTMTDRMDRILNFLEAESPVPRKKPNR